MNSFLTTAATLVALIPQPTAVEPPGVGPFMAQLGGYLLWGGGAVGVLALIAAGIKMMGGRNGRSNMAADGLGMIPWVLGGCVVMMSAGGLITGVLGF